MHVPAITYGTPDPLAAILPRADAGTLHAMASYFEHLAGQCRSAARTIERRAFEAEKAQEAREDAKARMLRLGARVSALARLRGSLAAAKAALHRRDPAHTLEALGWAHTAWQRLRQAKTTRTRNLAIWKARNAGETEKAVGARFGISARQVRKIVAEIEGRLSAL